MKNYNKIAIVVTAIFVSLLIMNGALATECWDYTNKTACLEDSTCRWDIWGKNCFQRGCWDFWQESDCNSAASEYNLSCTWATEAGGWGWCEDSASCWNYYDNNSVDGCEAGGANCVWEGQAICQEINCWNYWTQAECENHSAQNCEWDGWSCMETGGCWDYSTETNCDAGSGCSWHSNAFCSERGCWNYMTETECDTDDTCAWEQDEWSPQGGWCMEVESCWKFPTEEQCNTSAKCYWNEDGGGDTSGGCMFKDCMMFSGTNATACESNTIGLSCSWQGECHYTSTGGGVDCWAYPDQYSCELGGCEWGSCMMQGCWDYTNQTACEAASCRWDSEWSNCMDVGCWDYSNQTSCSADTDCTWMSSMGWCEEENCWNYNTQTDCDAATISCSWDTNGNYCYEQGCWGYTDQATCEVNSENGMDCKWNEGDPGWCERPGCWGFNNASACSQQTNCEWDTSGWCSERGAWYYRNESTCSGAGYNWEGGGWCEDSGCWNNDNKIDCDAQEQCSWNDQWSYCERVQCWTFESQALCEQHNTTLDCAWDGWSCYERGCWNYWNNATACNEHNATDGCSWNVQGQCYEQQCWNYANQTVCEADTDCQWDTYCSGDGTLDCWQYNDNQNDCVANGCKWDGWCEEKGCWSYDTRENCCGTTDCTANNDCAWEDTGWCKEVGCWDYYNQTACTAVTGCEWSGWCSGDAALFCWENNNQNDCELAGCRWDGWCSEEGCWDYTNQTACTQQSARDCAWDSAGDYCYEQGCWDYTTESQCNSQSSAGCAWDSNMENCYKEGCWSYSSSADCDAQTNCEWEDSGWCYSLSCWNYDSETDCTANAVCAWDSNWDYCYEKGCWDYANDTACNATTKCAWDEAGADCFEQGCWNYYDNNSADGCGTNSNCYWDDGAGWCEEGGCWDYTTRVNCEADATGYGNCAWDSNWNNCYEEGCWANENETDCNADARTCNWHEDNWGYCWEEGCWDLDTETECDASALNCEWDSNWDYCYEKGCWDYSDAGSCNPVTGCEWHTENWGWCEETRCWDHESETACTNTSDAIDCIWSAPDCFEVECAAYDGDETACTVTALSTYGLNCTYDAATDMCDPAAGYCSQYNGREWDCMDTFYCFYDWQTDECKEPGDIGATGASEDAMEFNPGCWLFDLNGTDCNNTNVCEHDGSSCNTQAAYSGQVVQCENITDENLCITLPALTSCCKWRNDECATDYRDKKCHDNIKEPPEGAKFCDDYAAYGSQDLCEKIANSPWYMPCRWNGQECGFNFDDAVGSGGDVFDIKTQGLCEKAGHEWVCNQYCDDMGTPTNISDDMKRSDCWCERKTGTGNCQKSCWVCEYQNNGSAWNSSTAAQDACEGSASRCEFTADTSAPNGYGYCEFSTSTQETGGCDSSCAACNDIVDNTQTDQNEPKVNCKQSTADCKWVTNLANQSKGTCKKKSAKTCSDKCFECTQAECNSYGVGEAGKCSWDEEGEFCQPANFNDEVCFNDKDDDNDGMVDCEDKDCFFSPECGEAGEMSNCWTYDADGATVCNASLDSNGANCTWFDDPWGGGWCAHPSEMCWQYNEDPASCAGDWCTFTTTAGHCDINKTSAEKCFGKAESACTGDCQWIKDQNHPKGGFCDYKLFSICHDPDVGTQADCTGETNSQYCAWMNDPDSPSGGHCEPICFNLNNASCQQNAKCEWRSGWCEPNIAMGDDCWNYDGNESGCGEQPGCVWQDITWGSECEPDVNALTQCWDLYWDAGTCNADDDCKWIVDEYSMDRAGHCENKAFACWQFDGDETGCTIFGHGCEYDTGSGLCDPGCFQLSDADCQANSSCMLRTGFCNPKGAGKMFDMMKVPPAVVAEDDCPESGKRGHEDLCSLRVKDDFDGFGVGLKVYDMENASTCNGEAIVTTPGAAGTGGSGTLPLTAHIYMDSDGISTGGCNATGNLQAGFEFKLLIESTQSAKAKLSVYECIDRTWQASNVEGSTMANVMCGEAHGPAVRLEKDTLFETNKFDMGYDMKLYGLTINTTSGSIMDAVSGTYTPGSVDTMKEDCMGFEDTDGDGLIPEKDPDCKFEFKEGGMVFENCLNSVDDDLDGDADCDDKDCKMLPTCGGSLFDFEVTNDTTMAEVSTYDIESLVDEVSVTYASSEPANGTVLFYGSDSSCLTLNNSVYDKGITSDSVPQYRVQHGGPPIDGLETNTTYYLKIKVCDKAGNPCGESRCLNFTTYASMSACGIKCQPVFDVSYDAPDADDNLKDTDVEWNFGEGYQAKGCGGTASFKKNYSETENTSVRLINDDADTKWSLSMENFDIKGMVDTNKTTIQEDEIFANETDAGIEYVGMDHDRWAAINEELLPETVTICVPGNVNYLYYCTNESAVSTTDCTDVTDLAVSGPTYNSTLGCTEFTVPADLGFSVYFGSGVAGDDTGDDTGDDDTTTTGGGGGGAAGTPLPQESSTIGFIAAGSTVKGTFSKADTLYVSDISITAKNEIKNAMVKVTKYLTKPVSVSSLSNVYVYLNIQKFNFADEDMSKGVVSFKVEKSWLTDNGLDADTVVLQRYTDAAGWTTLTTTKTLTGAEWMYYSAETPGFSFFAITAEAAPAVEEVAPVTAEITAPTAPEEEAAPPAKAPEEAAVVEEPVKPIAKVVPTWAIGLIAVAIIVVIGGGYWYTTQKK